MMKQKTGILAVALLVLSSGLNTGLIVSESGVLDDIVEGSVIASIIASDPLLTVHTEEGVEFQSNGETVKFSHDLGTITSGTVESFDVTLTRGDLPDSVNAVQVMVFGLIEPLRLTAEVDSGESLDRIYDTEWVLGLNEDTNRTIKFNLIIPRDTGYAGAVSITLDFSFSCINDELKPSVEEPEEPAPTVTPVAYWSLDEDISDIIHDSIGDNDGEISGADWTSGVNGSALSFNGIDDWVEIPEDPVFDLTDQVSIELWAYLEDYGTMKVFQKGDWDGYGIGVDNWGGWKASVELSNGEDIKVDWGDGRPDLESWYYIVSTYDGETLILYVNGEQVGSETYNGSLRLNNRPISIGSDSGSQKFYNGAIDEVALYNETLSPEYILEKYSSLNSSEPEAESQEGLVSKWSFNEGTGEIAKDSQNINDGTINDALWTTGVDSFGLSFDEASVEIENESSLNPVSEITVEAWVKWSIDPDSGEAWANIVNKGGEHQYQLQHSSQNDLFEFAVETNVTRSYVQSTTETQQGVWYHVVGTYSDNEDRLAIYVNGELEATKIFSGAINIQDDPLFIGRHEWGNRDFTGVIDEVAIYNKALTDTEIQDLYNSMLPIEE